MSLNNHYVSSYHFKDTIEYLVGNHQMCCCLWCLLKCPDKMSEQAQNFSDIMEFGLTMTEIVSSLLSTGLDTMSDFLVRQLPKMVGNCPVSNCISGSVV